MLLLFCFLNAGAKTGLGRLVRGGCRPAERGNALPSPAGTGGALVLREREYVLRPSTSFRSGRVPSDRRLPSGPATYQRQSGKQPGRTLRQVPRLTRRLRNGRRVRGLFARLSRTAWRLNWLHIHGCANHEKSSSRELVVVVAGCRRGLGEIRGQWAVPVQASARRSSAEFVNLEPDRPEGRRVSLTPSSDRTGPTRFSCSRGPARPHVTERPDEQARRLPGNTTGGHVAAQDSRVS